MSVFKKSVPFDFPAKIVQVDTANYCYQIIKMVMSDQETHLLLIWTLSAMLDGTCTFLTNSVTPFVLKNELERVDIFVCFAWHI